MWLSLFLKEYANRIADRQFRTALMKKVWAAWRSLSEENWKEKVAKACQLRAEDVCVQLTNDYEAKIAEVKEGFFIFSFSLLCSPTLNISKVSLSANLKTCGLPAEQSSPVHKTTWRDPRSLLWF